MTSANFRADFEFLVGRGYDSSSVIGFILKEKMGTSFSAIARRKGVSLSLLLKVLRGERSDTHGIRGEVARLLGFDPWAER